MADTTVTDSLFSDIQNVLDKRGVSDPALEAILDIVLKDFDCPVGTIHSIDPSTGLLKLRAQRGIPEIILDKVRMIPIGKGMAGIAAERKEPVQVCNLQTDNSGVAKPGAKETKMEGSISIPLLLANSLYGTLGVAKPIAYEFSADETKRLMRIGHLLSKFLA
jgi:L-methionine (R)-S-oxide reductase